MSRLFVLCLTISTAFAVSSPEISAKSGKAPSTQLQPQQSQTQQQESAYKTSSLHDDSMLNAINAYAHQYDATSAAPVKSTQQQIYSQQFIPSHQLTSSPTIETNFQPMPAPQQQQPHSLSTPVIMQYLPQSPQLSDGGVQYLQLIPTRPLLVPISPFMSPQPYQAPHIVPTRNDIPPGLDSFGGYQTYANSLQNYRGYRINREIKPNNIPNDDLRLNLNEYMPSPKDAPAAAMRPRGRP